MTDKELKTLVDITEFWELREAAIKHIKKYRKELDEIKLDTNQRPKDELIGRINALKEFLNISEEEIED